MPEHAAGRTQVRRFPFDALRILATAAVICLHVSGSWLTSDGVGSRVWHICNLYNSAVRWSVPVFVMISGALLLDGDRTGSGRSMGRRALRIVTAFVFWSAVYALAGVGRPPVWSDVLRQFVTGHFHMWFLYMILGLYILTPLLRQIVRSRKATEYFLLLALVFNFLLPRILGLADLVTDPRLAGALDALRTAYDKMSMQLPVGYTGYYVLGYYLSLRSLGPGARRAIYALGALGLVWSAGMTALTAERTGLSTGWFHSNYDPGVMMTAAALFVLGKSVLPEAPGPRTARLAGELARCSFGAYLVHALVLERLLALWPLPAGMALSVPALTAVTFVLSMMISWVLNRIPGLDRYIV